MQSQLLEQCWDEPRREEIESFRAPDSCPVPHELIVARVFDRAVHKWRKQCENLGFYHKTFSIAT
jgi:hypothetical protein